MTSRIEGSQSKLWSIDWNIPVYKGL